MFQRSKFAFWPSNYMSEELSCVNTSIIYKKFYCAIFFFGMPAAYGSFQARGWIWATGVTGIPNPLYHKRDPCSLFFFFFFLTTMFLLKLYQKNENHQKSISGLCKFSSTRWTTRQTQIFQWGLHIFLVFLLLKRAPSVHFSFFLSVFLGLHPRHMEVPRLQVILER